MALTMQGETAAGAIVRSVSIIGLECCFSLLSTLLLSESLKRHAEFFSLESFSGAKERVFRPITWQDLGELLS